MNILSLDGGGIRGVYTAYLLKRIQEEHDLDYAKHFDLIAGTSTGSIIAAALAISYPIKKIVTLYEELGPRIFKRSLWAPPYWKTARQLFGASYDNRQLKKMLLDVFEDRTLSDTETKLILPATDILDGKVHVQKSNYDASFVRDPDRKIVDAVLASCAAPTFFDPYNVKPYLLADGGLWANNPSLVAVVDAYGRLKVPIADIYLLSIGTGTEKVTYSTRRGKLHGLFKYGLVWWRGTKALRLILSLQSQTSGNMTGLLLGENYLRINFEDDELPLDDPEVINDLQSKADDAFTHQSRTIAAFLEKMKYEKE